MINGLISMAFNILLNYSMIWISILLFHATVICVDIELPSFEELPPPIQYYSTGESQIELRCKVWPNKATIKFVVSTKKQWSQDFSKSIAISPLEKSLGQIISPGVLRLTPDQLTQIHGVDIHCLAATDFGTILSRPFRVARATITNFGGNNNNIKETKSDFLSGNVAFIDCWPPESHPRAEVVFTFNGKEIKEGGKYRIVYWIEPKKVTLLIHSADINNNGNYQCKAINPITKETKTSNEIVQLNIENPKGSVTPSILMPISGRTSGAFQINARPGANVTLFCIMKGSPPPTVKVDNTNNPSSNNPRYKYDSNFGLLQITNVTPTDTGSYMCSDAYLTSTVQLRVIEPLFIQQKPEDIVMDSESGDASFTCKSSKSSMTPTWFFNGQPISNVHNQSSIYLSDITKKSLGLYQCVIQDRDEWASAAAILSLKSYRLISRPNSDLSQIIKPPSSPEIDSESTIFPYLGARRIYYNLAVFIEWRMNKKDLGPVMHYIIDVSHRIDESKWSNPDTIQEKINATFFYVTEKYIQAQNKYRFRVHAYFESSHIVTSIWTNILSFMDMGTESPIIKELKAEEPDKLLIRWSYANIHNWQVNTFRILYRNVYLNESESSRKYSKYVYMDVNYPTMNVTLEKLDSGATYQVVIFGLYITPSTNTSTKFSESQMVTLPIIKKISEGKTTQPSSDWFKNLWESWKSNKVLYGSLFALTGLMLLIMFLLLLLCLCRQRKFRTNKGMGSTSGFPYNYKEVSKTSAVNNSSSTLQIPGRMPQHSSQLGLQQYQQNNGSLDRRNTDTSSQIYRTGSVQAMETASLVTDLYGNNYMHGIQMNHMQHPYQGFSTLQPQNYPNNHGRSVPQYHNFIQQQQQQQQQQQHLQQHHAQMGSLLRENPAGDSNRDSITDQSMEMAPRNITGNPQQMQHYMRYYDQRQGAMSPQMMMMMMGSQQSLANSGQYRRSNSQNYSIPSVETPIAINPSGHPIYQMDQVLVDSSGRPLSPQYHYMQQQQQQQQQHHQQQTSHLGQLHPSMMDMYNQPHAFSRPIAAEYQQSLNRQQYRRSDSDCGSHEPGYSYLPTPHGTEMVSSRQHTLNSLPEQPMDNNNHDQHDSPGPIITNNNNSSGRHHHRRKTRSRQANNPEPTSLERSQVLNNHNDMPPMLAPRSKLPYSEHQGTHRLSAHDMNTIDSHDNAMNDCNSESNTAGAVSDNFDPPLQYSGHYDTNESKYRMDCNIDMNDNEATPSNSLLIENLPRVRDVSEYGIPLNNNNHNLKQAPVPPLKSNNRHNPVPSNGYSLECNPDYYSSATSSDRSGPSPPPKYAPGVVLPARPDEMYMRDQREGMYYHGDTHC